MFPAVAVGFAVGAVLSHFAGAKQKKISLYNHACPSSLYDKNGACFTSPGQQSTVPNSDFDDQGGQVCQCWANVDVFGNIQDHHTCYPSHEDAASKTNGFPGKPRDNQGGDYMTPVMCPAHFMSQQVTAQDAPPATSGYFTGQADWLSDYMYSVDPAWFMSQSLTGPVAAGASMVETVASPAQLSLRQRYEMGKIATGCQAGNVAVGFQSTTWWSPHY